MIRILLILAVTLSAALAQAPQRALTLATGTGAILWPTDPALLIKFRTDLGLGPSADVTFDLLTVAELTASQIQVSFLQAAEVSVGDAGIDFSPTGQVVTRTHLSTPAVTVKATTGDPSAPAGSEPTICINSFDNNVKIYADGAWRQLATW